MQSDGAQPHELVSKERLNNGSRRACRQFSTRPSTFPLPLCSSLSLRRWTDMHHIQWSWVVWILFGFWQGEPWQEAGGESEVRVFNLLGPSLLKVSALLKTMGDSLSTPWNFSFSPSFRSRPWFLYHSLGFSYKYFPACNAPLCRLILPENPQWNMPSACCRGTLFERRSWERWRGKMTIWHLWKTQRWVEREDGNAVWSLEARPGQGQCKSGLMSSHNEEDQSQAGLVCRGTGF